MGSNLLLNYLVFVHQTEEVFGTYLWGKDASHVVHYNLFYGRSRKALKTKQMSNILETFTRQYLEVELNVSSYQHLAAALGCHFLVGMIDPEEDITTMPWLEGRPLHQKQFMVFSLERLCILIIVHAMAHLWHSKVLQLSLEGHVATLDQILQ